MKSLADYKTYDEIYVDGMNLLSRSFHGMDHLEYKGVKTGMLYGVVRFFSTYRRANPRASIVFLWEGKDSWRKKKYPFYKAKRKLRSTGVDKSEFFDNVDRVKEVLPIMGVRQEWVDTMEADDLAYHHCQLMNVVGKKLLMVSTDEDWYICSRSNVDILYRSGIKTALKVDTELGFPGLRLTLFKTLKGCSTDEVSGVPRFPTKLAVILARSCDSMSGFGDKLKQLGEDFWAQRLVDNLWIVERNKEIVTPADISSKDIQNIDGQYDYKSLCKSLLSYGMENVVNSLRE